MKQLSLFDNNGGLAPAPDVKDLSGKWLLFTGKKGEVNRIICNRCGYEKSLEGIKGKFVLPSYCIECGSRMGEEE